ncbi:unnamed protein product [Meloidogyne enterolobii]|uniref:Uncharacterized protein n=1 Tax=Meloidogyne enterolobii TaxID=390850 RepID=A0ACB0ZUX8_MELEN
MTGFIKFLKIYFIHQSFTVKIKKLVFLKMSAKIFIIFVVFTVVFIHLCCMGGKDVGRKTLKKQNSFPKSTYTPPPG